MTSRWLLIIPSKKRLPEVIVGRIIEMMMKKKI
jgi:hypothetical protein